MAALLFCCLDGGYLHCLQLCLLLLHGVPSCCLSLVKFQKFNGLHDVSSIFYQVCGVEVANTDFGPQNTHSIQFALCYFVFS